VKYLPQKDDFTGTLRLDFGIRMLNLYGKPVHPRKQTKLKDFLTVKLYNYC